jgi:hypothetical protein
MKAMKTVLNENNVSHAHVFNIIANAPTIEADSGETVAWRYKLTLKSNWQYSSNYPTGCEDCCAEIIEPLYTAPQKREWIELTDGQIDALHKEHKIYKPTLLKIQALLKEVNHG